MKSARFVVYELLKKMNKNAYSNLALDGELSKAELSGQDKNFVTRLFYGVIERKMTLEYIITMYSSKPLHKLDRDICIIIMIGLYQLLYMDSVPDNAAVNEAVELTKQIKKVSASGFVNAVLRNFIRDKKKITLPKDKIKALSIEYSCDEKLVQMLLDDYGETDTIDLLSSSLDTHTSFIRVNNTKTSDDELIRKFFEIGITAYKHELVSNCLVIDKLGSVENNELFNDGLFHVQDLSSQLCCMALNPHDNDIILDICSAPGGKAFTITEIMNDNGTVVACDLHQKRVNIIENGAKRLGFASIKALQNDAKIFNADFPKFNKILCDVPCSGFGVMRSKPEIKYKSIDDVAGLPNIQYDILNKASEYLEAGGEIVYSTCTLSKKENDDVIERFLNEHKNFEGVPFLEDMGEPFGSYKASIFPHHFGCEGFFISKIKRNS